MAGRGDNRLKKLGFYVGQSGAHAGRSLMLDDLATLLAHIPSTAKNADYVRAIMDDNILAKATYNNRDHAARRMRQLYALDADNCLYRNFRRMWDMDPESRTLLAVLLALTRDALFRASAAIITAIPVGARLPDEAINAALDSLSSGRMGENTLRHAAGNILNSWRQAGFLSSDPEPVRKRVVTGVGAVAFALFLGWLEGRQGEALFKTPWAAVLDRPFAELVEQASAASRRGRLQFLNAGGVLEVRFPGYLTREEESL